MAALFDQSVLESLPQEQRRKLVKKARQHQINQYLEREKELAKTGDTGSARRDRRPNERIVHFNASDKLRDAINNFYDKEGKEFTTFIKGVTPIEPLPHFNITYGFSARTSRRRS